MSEINVMKKIFLDKIVLNIGTGKSGSILESAKIALDQITNKKCKTCTKGLGCSKWRTNSGSSNCEKKRRSSIIKTSFNS